MSDIEAKIREKARELWLAEGQPEGRADQHWLEAEAIVRAEAEAARRRRQEGAVRSQGAGCQEARRQEGAGKEGSGQERARQEAVAQGGLRLTRRPRQRQLVDKAGRRRCAVRTGCLMSRPSCWGAVT